MLIDVLIPLEHGSLGLTKYMARQSLFIYRYIYQFFKRSLAKSFPFGIFLFLIIFAVKYWKLSEMDSFFISLELYATVIDIVWLVAPSNVIFTVAGAFTGYSCLALAGFHWSSPVLTRSHLLFSTPPSSHALFSYFTYYYFFFN